LVSIGPNLKILDFKANCSGLLFTTRIVAFEFVGFYNSASIKAETPRGDLILLIMTGGLGWHIKLNS
jgi:hypothetical protein